MHCFALVVTSDARLRIRLTEVLVSRGYVVHTSESAESASALSGEVTFSVVVTGPEQVSQAAHAVRALLRQEGLIHAVVFHFAGDDTKGIDAPALAEITLDEDLAARLRLSVPAANAIASQRRAT